jgi:hypothetical protein
MKINLRKKWFDGLTAGNQAYSTKSFKRGFALLFSVLVSSLLLAVGLSIFNIALKELAISTATRHSITAFYAADSGREKVIYLNLKSDKYKLAADEVELTIDETEGFVIESDADNSPYFKFKGKKTIGIDGKINTEITSTGWNIEYGDKVEREIEQTY